MMSMFKYGVAALLVTSSACLVAVGQITIPTVTIGNAGNPADGTGYGAVAYEYKIGTYEVTVAQFAAFLNAKAASDPFGMYATPMGAFQCGILRSGSSGSYTYSVVSGRENHPVNWVSFWTAARFVNWMHNGQGQGDTETGAYTLTTQSTNANTVTRNPDWLWALPSEDEWFKAAYHQPASEGGDVDHYWDYSSGNNDGYLQGTVNAGGTLDNTTPVGSFLPNFYGTFDMGGNVYEYNESISGGNRGIRGGAFNVSISALVARSRSSLFANARNNSYGFRIVQRVEAPACPADFNRDGGIDFFDYLDFVAAFSTGDGSADFNGDTSIDFFDYLDFVAAFSVGCG